ncbi:MAG TPA: GNAT family N-acetyltransferase [Actinophytocola sp.]|jgi:ribosomal protein S18 acetylase RimI-like enzyme|uniref:GNAT family N-acetyltransferase n=1 Tax=Actinophytocola sp. TaxID=1872138 RepID=UPI002F946D90
MSEITIRLARPEEYEVAGRLTVEAYRASGYPEADSPYAVKLADGATRAREAELWVAVDGADTVLGTVTMAPPTSPWAEVAGKADLEFRMLAVGEAARGRGVGEALTRAVVDRAAELGLTGVVLSSSTEMTTAHRIYERLGFHRTPDKDWQPTPRTSLLTYRLDLR